MINPQTNREFTRDFFKKYARGKPCQIRVARSCGYECDSQDSVVLCHISLAGLKAMGKKLIPDLLGAWGCSVCHELVDGRRQPAIEDFPPTTTELKLWHLEGMARTQAQLIADGVLPNV